MNDVTRCAMRNRRRVFDDRGGIENRTLVWDNETRLRGNAGRLMQVGDDGFDVGGRPTRNGGGDLREQGAGFQEDRCGCSDDVDELANCSSEPPLKAWCRSDDLNRPSDDRCGFAHHGS